MWNRFEGFCENFVSKGIVIVMYNYRLGPLGFASTGDSVMPGNLGLHDQSLALQWTLKNVKHFGGDPDDITAWGFSSGAMTVGLLALSPYTRDHIKKTIHNSGSYLSAFALSDQVVTYTYDLAKALGCPSTNSHDIKEFIKTKSVDELLEASEKIGRANTTFTFKWTPRIDGDFLPYDVTTLIRDVKPIPTLHGYSTEEMIYFYNGFLEAMHYYTITPDQLKYFDQAELAKRIKNLHFTEEEYGSDARLIADKAIEFYAKRNVPSDADPKFFLNREQEMLSHLRSLVPMFIEYFEKQKRGFPVFVYQNCYWREGHFTEDQPLRGCMHVSEMKQFCNTPLPSNYEFNEEDLKHKHVLVQSHINFVKTGNPSFDRVEWPQITDQNPYHNLIVKPEPEVSTFFKGDQLALYFWMDMVRIFGLKLVRTKHANRIIKEDKRARL